METVISTNIIQIQFPDNYLLSEECINKLQKCNPKYIFNNSENNFLNITPIDFTLEEFRYHDILIPGFNVKLYDELCELNEDGIVTYEYSNQILHIRTATYGLFSAIIVAIGAELHFWTKKNKLGRTYSGKGHYRLTDPETGEEICRNPDVSFVSYEKADEDTQKKWAKSMIDIPPTLAIEIVSSKRGLKPALKKVQEVWMKFGAEIGLVVCPFTKKIYIFEKDKPGNTEQSVFVPFTNPLLPGYTGDFSDYMNDI